jgi:predicted acetyltransferase
MEIDLQPASINDKPVLRNLLELYQYDFSEYENSDVDEHGLYGYRYLDHYWTDPNRYAYLVRVDHALAGFALLRVIHDNPGSPTHSVAEFFVMRKYRRRGVGREVACRLFDLFPGRWRVEEEKDNLPAQAFWHKVIDEYMRGNFEEMRPVNVEWVGLVQLFRTEGGDSELEMD